MVEQGYSHLNLIIIDNGSTDQSPALISDFVRQYPTAQYLANPINVGLNRAFNQGLALATGKYIIDFAVDDVMLPGRLAKQVALFEQLPLSYGVIFTNAILIDEAGQFLRYHYPVDATGKADVMVPSGLVFRSVLTAYFICTPTMMMRRSMLLELGGYDEALIYEDFDVWVRSARSYQYAYLDEVLTYKRQVTGSLSAQVYEPANTLLQSTWVVCQKALALCQDADELEALAQRIQSFIRKSFYAEQFDLARRFGHLLSQIRSPDKLTWFVLLLSRLRIPINGFYRRYLHWKRKLV